MKFRSVSPSVTDAPHTVTAPKRISLKVALWLLDSPRLGHNVNVKHFAGRLLKQPAREGVVAAQSRLGQLMYRECGNARDRRIGHDLLRLAARAGDRRAQRELGQVED
ncbi:SEL1-like repeat protein [Pseudomonas marginalis]|uniref:sel1 repeat family protein n=1 Tax=Pseudomonas marginalis TaxID=298 RepID=UPI002A36AF06|nr:sel1 repeat family protein [Pseudomonas marginalis]WPN22167.1 sel1 repeat family protein [Pseudomonas marginalis]